MKVGMQQVARHEAEFEVEAEVEAEGEARRSDRVTRGSNRVTGRAPGAGREAAQVLAGFQAALSALVESGAQHYGDGGSIEILHREITRLDAFITEASAAFDAEEAWSDDGAKNAAAWITTKCKLPKVAAHRRVNLGRAMRD
jgi:hypothetical protein